MGAHDNIRHDLFPKQGDYLGRRVSVCFHYDASHQIGGKIVREDTEEPGRSIIALDDGRYVLTTECMWSPAAAHDGKIRAAEQSRASTPAVDREARKDSDFAWIVPRHATDAMMQAGLYHCPADMGWADLFTAFHYMVDEAQQDDAILALHQPASTPAVDREAIVAELSPLVEKAAGPNGWDWMFPLRVKPVDGKPTIVSHKGGNLFRGYIGTWQQADLLVALANAAPQIILALHPLAAAPTPPTDATAMGDAEREALRREIINTPETADFMAGVPLEAAHQRERWGVDHDAGKSPFDWFWLVGYLAQKAASSAVAGNSEKAMHHTISTAAALANWHAALSGVDTAMRPGIADPETRHD